MGMYYNYHGQYSRLNQHVLFGHHQEWDPFYSTFDKCKSFGAAYVKKISRFSEVTFKPGYKIIKIDPEKTSYVIERNFTNRHIEYGFPQFSEPVYSRSLFNTRFGCTLGDNRDVIPDDDTTLTVFAGEYFLGNKVLRIVADDGSGLFVEYLDKSNFFIAKNKIISVVPEKVY